MWALMFFVATMVGLALAVGIAALMSSRSMQCRRCAMVIPANGRFCPRCGAAVST